MNGAAGNDPRAGSPLEVFRVFLKLGVSSFGGPIAHIGYFREEFVVRRRWLSEQTFVDLVALCQFLPGPASSQTGFAIGLIRAGYGGALAAWAGFTLAVGDPDGAVRLRRRHAVGPDRRRTAAWSQARRRRHCRASGVGHGAQPLSRPRARVDRDLERPRHPLQHVVGGADRGNRARRRARPMALPRSAADDGGPHRHPGIAPRRFFGASRVFHFARRLADRAKAFRLLRARAVRCFLSFRRAGVRRRPRRAAVAARSVRRARLGQR